MSDFILRETLPDLWEEILQRHWTFLETEESIQKLEERKKLEGYLKEFMCIVPHDRKFFLPETAHVLKTSVKEGDFSAYKAMIGFESISQYANNLFTKPWRKEYRVIKMYSGFYQHEIKSNLVDADKLFEAMGYKQFPNQVLMLDGPICPDQVTNVSRDAMAAYVECQIMKNIFSGLTSMQLSCSWLDIYNFREIHIGGITQAVKSMAFVIQEKKYRKEKINSDNCYSAVQPLQATPATSSYPSCTHTCHPQMQQISNNCSIHHMPPQHNYVSVCSLHPQQNIFMQNNIPVPLHYKLHNCPPSQMSHSKSLEHYVDHTVPPSVFPHRHSFDQPHYDTSYDCLDGYQSCGMNAYNHPYNVSGNRYPLPFNISTQLNNQLQSGNCGFQSHYSPMQPPPPSVVNFGHKIPLECDQIHLDCNGHGKNNQKICSFHINGKDLINYRQYNLSKNNTVASDQLIDFEDRPKECIQNQHRSHSYNNSFDYNDKNVQKMTKQNISQYDIPKPNQAVSNQTLKDLNNREADDVTNENDDNYLYSTVRNEKKSALKRSTDKYIRNAEILEQYQRIIDNNEHKSGGIHDSNGSYEEVMEGGSANDSNHSVQQKSSVNKNQDGVGSFESWDYVFQNLEKHGYNKDLGERGDLLVQGLDLDLMNINSATDKRRSRIETKNKSTNEIAKPNQLIAKKDSTKDSILKSSKIHDKAIIPKNENESKQKSVQVSKLNQQLTVDRQKLAKTLTNNSNSVSKISPNNNNFVENNISSIQSSSGPRLPSSNGILVANHCQTVADTVESSNTNTSRQTGILTATSTVVAVSAPNEWSCRFCTYLNPETRRICEMCCRSRDFVLDVTNSATCV